MFFLIFAPYFLYKGIRDTGQEHVFTPASSNGKQTEYEVELKSRYKETDKNKTET